jgi:hypothetical protein
VIAEVEENIGVAENKEEVRVMASISYTHHLFYEQLIDIGWN